MIAARRPTAFGAGYIIAPGPPPAASKFATPRYETDPSLGIRNAHIAPLADADSVALVCGADSVACAPTVNAAWHSSAICTTSGDKARLIALASAAYLLKGPRKLSLPSSMD